MLEGNTKELENYLSVIFASLKKGFLKHGGRSSGAGRKVN